ncbi:MAG TPA: hypothetical protein V6D31_02200 [Candidatus Sericytochromatia bacterium]
MSERFDFFLNVRPERFIVALAQALNFPSRSSMAANLASIGSSLVAIWMSTVSAIFVDKPVDATLEVLDVDTPVNNSVDKPNSPPADITLSIRWQH